MASETTSRTKKLSGRIAGYTTLFMTALVLGLFISFYLWFYVSRNEQKLYDRNFRALHRVETNAGFLIRDMARLAWQLPRDAERIILINKRDNYLLSSVLDSIDTKFDRVQITESTDQSGTSKKIRTGVQSNNSIPAVDTPPDSGKIGLIGDEESIVFQNRFLDPGKGVAQMSISLKHFLASLFKYDYFTGYVLLKGNKILFNDLGQRLDSAKTDSLLNHVASLKTQSVRPIEITGDGYTLFTIPFSLFSDDNYMLIGVTPTKSINAEKMYVSDTYVFLLLFLLLGIAVAFPFLKIFLMSRYEKMKAFDIMLMVFSFTFVTGLFFYVWFSQYQYRVTDKNKYAKLQSELARDIGKNLTLDIRRAQRQLIVFDRMLPETPGDLVNIFTVPTWQEKFPIPRKLDGKPLPKIDDRFKLAFWLAENGRDTIRWTNELSIPVRAKFVERDYFKNVSKGVFWRWPDDTLPPFTIQPIRSWTDGQFRAIIAQKPRSKEVDINGKKVRLAGAGISAKLPSVISAVLPYGFSFCIADEHGDVWFHSDQNRNLNENILEECNKNKTLVAAFETRTEAEFTENYSGFQAQLHVKPVDELPLFVVVIMDKSPLMIKNINVFLLSLFFLVSQLMIIGLQIALLLLFNIRNTKLKANKLRLDTFWPNRTMIPVYNKSMLLNIILLIATIMFTEIAHARNNPQLAYLICFLNSYVALTSFYAVCNTRYFIKITHASRLLSFRIYAVLFPVAVSVFCLCKADPTTRLQAAAYLAGAYLLAGLLFHKEFINGVTREYANPSEHPEVENQKMIRGYSGMLLTWALMAAFLPVYVFFPIAVDFEAVVMARQHQASWVEGINRITDRSQTPNNYAQFLKLDNSNNNNMLYTSGSFYHTEIKGAFDTTGFYNGYHRGPEYSIARLDLLPQFGFSKITNHDHMYGSVGRQDITTYLWWSRHNNKTLELQAADARLSGKYPGDILHLSTDVPMYQFPGTTDSMIAKGPIAFYGIAILSAFILYFLISFFIRKIFLPEILSSDKESQSDILNYLAKSSPPKDEGDHGLRLIVVSLPHSGKNKFFRKKENFEKFKKIEIDFTLMESPVPWLDELAKVKNGKANDLVICQNFEYNLSVPGTSRKKLEFIELLNRNNYKNIVIISSIHPSTFLNHVSKRDDESQGMTTDITELIKDSNYYTWSAVLTSFEVVYYPLDRFDYKPSSGLKSVYEILQRECSHGLFLNHMLLNHGLDLNNTTNTEGNKKNGIKLRIEEVEELYLRIQNLAYSYYLSLWNTLTREEQYVLYDLAEDGLVNYKNFEPLSRLHLMGLIIQEGSLSVMNRSFRNFILTEVRKGSPINSDAERSRDSAWKRFRLPFYMIFLVVIFFIFYTQQESFNTLITIVGSFTASLPLILKLWNTMTSGKNEKGQ